MRGWIVYNGNLGDKFLEHAVLFSNSARKLDITTEIIQNNMLFSYFTERGVPTLIGWKTGEYPDFVLFWDKDIYLARQLEKMGLPVFNSSRVIETCDDKCATYQALSGRDVPMPKTILAPKVYDWSGVQQLEVYDYVTDTLGFPMVIKEAVGSFGSQVYLINNKDQMLDKVRELGSIPFLFQEMITSSYGTDLRLQVVGDKVVAAMRRVSATDFRANCGQGANPYAHTPTSEQIALALECCRILGADFAGVDLLFGPNQEPILCEVNSNAHIINLQRATGVNVADFMLAYIKKTVELGA